jgi:hypothetical protein
MNLTQALLQRGPNFKEVVIQVEPPKPQKPRPKPRPAYRQHKKAQIN